MAKRKRPIPEEVMEDLARRVQVLEECHTRAELVDGVAHVLQGLFSVVVHEVIVEALDRASVKEWDEEAYECPRCGVKARESPESDICLGCALEIPEGDDGK